MNREDQINAALELIQDALRKGEIEERADHLGQGQFTTARNTIIIEVDKHPSWTHRAKPMKAEDYCRLIMDAYPSSTMAYEAAEAILEALKND